MAVTSPGPVSTTDRDGDGDRDTTPTLSLDDDTRAWIQQLYDAWSSNAPVSTFAAIRDGLLGQREHLDTRISTLSSVAKIACSHRAGSDSAWDELFALAGLIKSRSNGSSKKRKRGYNEANRLRNLALVAAFWSPAIVFHYGWNTASQVQMNMLRACAVRYPRFADDFRPRLNCVLLERHRQGIKHGRAKTLNEAPLQPHRDFDLGTLALAAPDESIANRWVTSDDGHVPVDAVGTLLKDLRPIHFRMHLLRVDRYGLLVARGNECTPSSPPAVDILPSKPALDPLCDPSTSTSDEISSPAELQWPLEYEFQARPDVDLSFELSPTTPQTSASSLDSAFFGLSEDVQFPDIGWDGELHNGPSTLASGFDLGLESADSLPELLTSLWRHEKPRTTITGGSLYQTCPSSSPAHCPQQKTIRSAGPASPYHLTQAADDWEALLAPPPVDNQDALTVEETLRTRYRGMIASYITMVSDEAKREDAGEQRKLRAEWLSPATRWASVWTKPESSLTRGRARSYEVADVLYLTSDELMMAAQKGEIFRKPIVIKEKFLDSGMHTVYDLALLLQDASSNAILNVSSLEHDPLVATYIDTLLKGLRTNSQEGDAITFNLRNITRSHRPLLTLLPRFRLLDSLAGRARGGDMGRQAMPKLVGTTSCTGFNTLSLAGAFSGAHLEAVSGVWMRNLDGVKFCTMVPEDDIDLDWEVFAKLGKDWVPNGKQKFLVLEQDDVLLIPPGLRVVYAMHSPTKGVMEGGNIWDSLNVVQTLHSIHWICQQRLTLNEAIAYKPPRLISELEVLVKHHPDHFRGEHSEDDFMRAFELAVSKFADLDYSSFADCEELCSCRREGRWCTAWCVAHLEMAHLACTQEHCTHDSSIHGNCIDGQYSSFNSEVAIP